ncbi:hypothetical protein, partial [Bartonella doshiae]|uniref:hypothetical protein n=1 Tax=Bartonella doshiae TaxID=33044 RepID=UPI001AEC99C7
SVILFFIILSADRIFTETFLKELVLEFNLSTIFHPDKKLNLSRQTAKTDSAKAKTTYPNKIIHSPLG